MPNLLKSEICFTKFKNYQNKPGIEKSEVMHFKHNVEFFLEFMEYRKKALKSLHDSRYEFRYGDITTFLQICLVKIAEGSCNCAGLIYLNSYINYSVSGLLNNNSNWYVDFNVFKGHFNYLNEHTFSSLNPRIYVPDCRFYLNSDIKYLDLNKILFETSVSLPYAHGNYFNIPITNSIEVNNLSSSDNSLMLATIFGGSLLLTTMYYYS